MSESQYHNMGNMPSQTNTSNGAKARQDDLVSESQLKTERGSHRFKINNYSHIRGMGTKKYVESGTFTIGGYKWLIRLYPDSDSEENSESIGVFLMLKGNAGEARANFCLYLVDPTGTTCHKKSAEHNFKGGNTWGYSAFLKRDILEASSCLNDDSFTIGCDVLVIKEPRIDIVPPSDIHERLGHLLSTKIGTDVDFEVDGVVLHAHRCILAASSPVFQAELYGPMKENKMKKIKIQDMEASVFKAMIYFIYNDSLPDINEDDTGSTTTMLQNLLCAADRYGLDRLRLTCEEKLCNCLDMSNVGTILALAEQHSLTQLQKACLEYFSAPKVLTSPAAPTTQ